MVNENELCVNCLSCKPMCSPSESLLSVPKSTAAYDFGRMVTNTTIDGGTYRSHGNRCSYMYYFVWDSGCERFTSNSQSVLLLLGDISGSDICAECFGLALEPGAGNPGLLYVRFTCLDKSQKGK